MKMLRCVWSCWCWLVQELRPASKVIHQTPCLPSDNYGSDPAETGSERGRWFVRFTVWSRGETDVAVAVFMKLVHEGKRSDTIYILDNSINTNAWMGQRNIFVLNSVWSCPLYIWYKTEQSSRIDFYKALVCLMVDSSQNTAEWGRSRRNVEMSSSLHFHSACETQTQSIRSIEANVDICQRTWRILEPLTPLSIRLSGNVMNQMRQLVDLFSIR